MFPRRSLEELAASVDYGVTASANAAPVGPKFLRITDIQDDRVDWATVPYCGVTPAEAEGARLNPGDVVFARTGATTGKSYLLNECPKGAVFASYLIRVRPLLTEVDPRYLAWYFQTPDYWRQITSSASGTAQPGVNATKLKSLSVPTPPLPEQRRIADVLEKADAVRRKRKEAIALSEELLRSAFLEMFGDPVTNPKGWPVRALGDVLRLPLRNGLSPSAGGGYAAKVLTLSAITRGHWNRDAVKDGAFAAEPWDDVRVDARDLLICRGNGNLALVGSAEFPEQSDAEIVFPDTMIAARVNNGLFGKAFLKHLWGTRLIRGQIEARARTTNGTFKVNQTAIESLSLLMPPMHLQERFDEVAAVARRLREHLAHPGHHALFESLVQRAFRGELTGAGGRRQLGFFGDGVRDVGA
jgi:type I restriction enzyme S subunit